MAGEDPDYTDWLRTLPCHECGRRRGSDPHHRQGAGIGMRSHDETAIPLCRPCHVAWHAGSGPFKSFDKKKKRAYHDEANDKYRSTYKWSNGPGG